MNPRVRRAARTFLTAVAAAFFLCAAPGPVAASPSPHVAVLDVDGPMLPGTGDYFTSSLRAAADAGAALVLVRLDTPGGSLQVTQEMVRDVFSSAVPVAVYVSPPGATAASAGVFLTLSAHVAAMAPGTTIGAAHPVSSSGADLGGDARAKAESIAISIVKTVSGERGRNVRWAERAVRESVSATEREAAAEGVIDFVARDVDDLLRGAAGKVVSAGGRSVTLPDLSGLPRVPYPRSYKQRVLDVLATPDVATLLWLVATAGISAELYHPGLVFPGVVGVVALLLALTVTQVLPIRHGALALVVVGFVMTAAELFVPSGLLGAAGVVSVLAGAWYLVDTTRAPDLSVSYGALVPALVLCGASVGAVAYLVRSARRRPPVTGAGSLVGRLATVTTPEGDKTRVALGGEYWFVEGVGPSPALSPGAKVRVKALGEGGTLVVEPLKD